MDAPSLQSLTTVAGAAVLVAVLLQLFLQASGLSPTSTDRWAPLIAVGLGIVIVEIATYTVVTGAQKADIIQGVINGIFAGLSAMGLHNVVIKNPLTIPKA